MEQKQEQEQTSQNETQMEEAEGLEQLGDETAGNKGGEEQVIEPTADGDNKALLDRIAALEARLAAGQNSQSMSQPQAQAEQQQSALTITDDEFNAAFDNPAAFAKIIEKGSMHAANTLVRALPGLVSALIAQEWDSRNAIAKFYAENPDFTNIKPLVSSVAQELEGKNPGMSHAQLLPLVAKEVRKRLPSYTNRKPGIQPSRTSRVTPKSDDLESEIDKLLTL